jgi:glycosyltransferase involved in cell wall biosynthesis
MLPKTLDHMIGHGLDPQKFSYIPNGIDLEEWLKPNDLKIDDQVSKVLEKVKKDQEAGYFTIAYFGTHGLSNALDYFINAAEILKNQKIKFYLIGGGPDKKRLQNLTENKKLEHVNFIEPIPKETIPILTTVFDSNYIGFLKKESLYRFGISPNKLMDYLAARKPIIVGLNPENDPTKDAHCGINVNPEDPEALAQGILKIMQLSKEERTEMGKNGFDFVKRNHDYRILAQKFLRELR